MLSPKRLNLGRGGHHESATGTTGPGDPGAKRLGDHHGARRRCGPPHRADDHDGLTRGLGPAYPAPLDATGAELGVDGRHLARAYSHRALVGFQGLMLKCASETLNLFIRPLKNNDFKEDAGRKNRVVRHYYIHDPGIQQEPWAITEPDGGVGA